MTARRRGIMEALRRLSTGARLPFIALIPFLIASQCCCQTLRFFADRVEASLASGHEESRAANLSNPRRPCCMESAAAADAPATRSTSDMVGCPAEDGQGGDDAGASGCRCALRNPILLVASGAVTLVPPAAHDVLPALFAGVAMEPEAPVVDRPRPATDLPPPRSSLPTAPDSGRAPPQIS